MATTTNSNAAAKRYKKVDPREHVLLRPGMYIGSTEPDRLRTWTLDPDSGRFVKRDVDYVPGLYKIFDEILVNSIDHGTRLKTIKNPPAQFQVKSIKISIDAATGFISVENDGDGIPVVIHPESGVYVPEMIFGQLMTSSNYDDAEERVIGGQNGIGAKACNIFSKRFTVETVDSHTLKKYVQTFRDNMSVRDPPKITMVAATKKPYTKITFLPDYKRFHCDGLSVDMHQVRFLKVFFQKKHAKNAASAKQIGWGVLLRVLGGLRGSWENMPKTLNRRLGWRTRVRFLEGLRGSR
jgi:DNA topoisomerase-2